MYKIAPTNKGYVILGDEIFTNKFTWGYNEDTRTIEWMKGNIIPIFATEVPYKLKGIPVFHTINQPSLSHSKEELMKAFNDGKLYGDNELELDTNGRETAFEVWYEDNVRKLVGVDLVKEYKSNKGIWKDVLLPSEWETDTKIRPKLIKMPVYPDGLLTVEKFYYDR